MAGKVRRARQRRVNSRLPSAGRSPAVAFVREVARAPTVVSSSPEVEQRAVEEWLERGGAVGRGARKGLLEEAETLHRSMPGSL